MPLVSHFPLHEDSGSTAYDIRGNNDGTVNGATQGVEGLLGTSAYSFDGTDDYINIGTPSLTGSISISYWLYPRAIKTQFDVNNYGGTSGAQNYILGLGPDASDGVPAFFIDNGTTSGVASSGIIVNTEQWYHLVGVYNDSSGEILLYVDGVQESIVSYSGNTPNWQERETYIGDSVSNDRKTDGKIADVRIYDHALSPSEVQYLYQVVQGTSSWTSTKKTL